MTSMDESWTNWLCDDMEPNNYSFINPSMETQSQCSYATLLYTENTTSSMGESSLERPSKVFKTTSCCSTTSNSANINTTSCSGSYTLSFENPNPPPPPLEPKTKVTNSKNTESIKKNDSMSRSTHHIPDHIIAERVRREKISQQFIALSALIPDLKKMDKASVLGEAIKYVKELKEQVKLKERGRKRKSVESATVFMKDVSDTSLSSCNGNSNESAAKTNMSLPEVNARVSGKNVLIRILWEKDKAMLSNIFREIQNLHLSVINCCFLSFGSSLLAITIIAKIEDEFKDVSEQILAQNFKVGLMQLMQGQ